MNNKHAYIIAAHDNLYILKKLIYLLDDPRNDLYVHIDVKCAEADAWMSKVKTFFSKLTFIKRRNVMWGGIAKST